MPLPKQQKCKYCTLPARKRVIHSEGMAYVPACLTHVEKAVEDAERSTPDGSRDPSNVDEVTDLASRAFPDLERKPGGPDNWVEQVGGLPDYIERIAKNLHYTKGMTISRSIAVAVNTVKRWARGGTVTKNGTTKRITPATQAKAAAAVADWERKKAQARAMKGTPRGGRRVNLSKAAKRANRIQDPTLKVQARRALLDLAGPPASVRKKAASNGNALPEGGFPINNVTDLRKAILAYGRAKNPEAAKRHIMKRARELGATGSLPASWKSGSVNLSNPRGAGLRPKQALLDRVNRIEDPATKGQARQRVLDLARGRTKDGRPSFKNQGKWRHGFKPVDGAAVQSKAKGSPIATRRIRRVYKPSGEQIKAKAGGQERVGDVGQARSADIRESRPGNRTVAPNLEAKVAPRINKRSEKPWDEIPETQKTTRGGQRYVLTTFGGKQQLTEWTGENASRDAPDAIVKRMSSIQQSDAQKFTTAQLRALLRIPGQPEAVLKVLNRVLRQKRQEADKG